MASVTRRVRRHLDEDKVRFAKKYLENPVTWCPERLQWIDAKPVPAPRRAAYPMWSP